MLPRALNIFFSLVMLVMAVPVAVIVWAISLKVNKGPLLYKGERLGKDKQKFIMYKFRTLPVDAEKKIGSDLLNKKHNMVTPFTKFMRDTRIDELPQLYNILRGDMAFIGPRPERQAVYEAHCKKIRDYDFRFTVKPGMIGYSQLFTPHSTPKVIRASIDNKNIQQGQDFFSSAFMVGITIGAVILTVCRKLSQLMWAAYKVDVKKSFNEKRRLERIGLGKIEFHLLDPVSRKPFAAGRVVDINEECIKLTAYTKLPSKFEVFWMPVDVFRDGHVKRIKMLFTGYVQTKKSVGKDVQGGAVYVIRYRAANKLHQYLIDQYLLRKSLASDFSMDQTALKRAVVGMFNQVLGFDKT